MTDKELSAERLAEIRAEFIDGYPAEVIFDELIPHIDALAARIAELEEQVRIEVTRKSKLLLAREPALNDLVYEGESLVEALKAARERIAELERPVEDAEAIDVVDVIFAVGHETARRVVNIFERLRRERDALKHDIDRHLTITAQQAEEIIAAEAERDALMVERDAFSRDRAGVPGFGGHMSDWQLIDPNGDQTLTPWDGRPVLIVTNHNWGGDDNRVHRARWTDAVHGHGIFGWAVDDCKHGPYGLRGYTVVTHWMPLPPPPVTP